MVQSACCGFSSLLFLFLRPRRGFSRLLFCSHAQFPLRDISISFRGGLFCLLFTPYAHAVGFLSYFSTPTPSFRSGTVRLASGVGFSARFFASSPTLWVSPAYFSTPTPSFHSATYRLASRVGFSACFSSPRVSPHRYRSVVYRRAHPKYVLRTYAPSSPTPWVSTPTFLLPHPKHYLEQTRL